MDQKAPHTAHSATLSQNVVPLLQALSSMEDKVSALALRLDPITNHTTSPTAETNPPYSQTTVTGRLQTLGGTLQYLLDHIEL